MVSEFAEFARVIGEIYDAAVDPLRWPKALEACCVFLDAFRVTLFWHDNATVEAAAMHEFNGDPHFTRLYLERYVALNPIFPAAAFLKPGQVIAVTDLVPQHELEATRFFREWVEPQGIVATIGAMLENDAMRGAFISFNWNHAVVVEDARARVALLVPHLQRAVTIGRLFANHRVVTDALEQTLHRVDDGVFLIGADGQMVFANVSGQKMIDAGTPLRQTRGILHAASAAPDRPLQEGLRSGEPHGVSVTLQDGAKGRWVATVLPLNDGVRRRVAGRHDAVAAVFVRQSTRADPSLLETLTLKHKLTATEIRVVDVMLRISSLDAMADALGISKATVKTHLHHVFRKCGAKNQGDLIRRIAGLAQRP